MGPSANDEINLIELFKSIVQFIRKNIKVLILSASIGALAGLAKILIEPSLFKSNLVAISNILNTEDVTPIIQNCKTLIEDENYAELASLLKLDSVEVRGIKNIDIKSQIIPNNKMKDEVLITNKFSIEVTVKSADLFVKLNNALPEMVSTNKYTKFKTNLLLESRKGIYDRIVQEIDLLDSLKRNQIPNRNANKAAFYLYAPSSINETVIKLYEKQMEIREGLETRQDFLVIQEFTKLTKPYNKKISSFGSNMAIGASIGLVMALFFAISKELKGLLQL
ncbi:MAG: hypothetical protein ACKVOU_01405 [Cytophagales bacterium]